MRSVAAARSSRRSPARRVDLRADCHRRIAGGSVYIFWFVFRTAARRRWERERIRMRRMELRDPNAMTTLVALLCEVLTRALAAIFGSFIENPSEMALTGAVSVRVSLTQRPCVTKRAPALN